MSHTELIVADFFVHASVPSAQLCSEDTVPGGGGGATLRLLGRQLPPPPLGAFGQQLVAKGVALRRPWAPKAPDAP